MNKIYLILIIFFLITGCGSGKEGDASKYSINETNIKYVTTPSQNYILSILKSNEYVDLIEPVTEKTDSNGKLNKDGGYYSAIFFSSNLLSYDDKESAVKNGTDGGGCIESFKTEEDAIERDKYLGRFKSSGGHVRLGTEVIRTSALLDANNQVVLEGTTEFVDIEDPTLFVYKRISEEEVLLSVGNFSTEKVAFVMPTDLSVEKGKIILSDTRGCLDDEMLLEPYECFTAVFSMR